MRDISFKVKSLRVAKASSVLKMQNSSLKHVKDNTGPKPDILATAKASAYLAIKNTANVIPHCHPIPVENVNVEFDFNENELTVFVEVTTIYKTGCEIEAIHGAQIAALTIYDMLKPIDQNIEINSTKLISKSGGKSDFRNQIDKTISSAVLVVSDSVSAGKKEDKAGKILHDKLVEFGLQSPKTDVVSDEIDQIQNQVKTYLNDKIEIILITGGTGLSPRDFTPEAIKPLLEREVSGIMEAARQYGLERTPLAMLSRGIAGMNGKSLIISLPGSSRGARESIDAIFPFVLHIFKVQRKYYQHEDVNNK